MVFFKPSPGLPLNDKARLEFHLQSLSECIGFEPMRAPVWLPMETFGHDCKTIDPFQVKNIVGKQLKYDFAGLSIEVKPEQLATCGGGG